MAQHDLVAGLIQGDEVAWKQFIVEYGGLILAIGARFGLRGPDRDDHLQTTCLSVVRSISSLRDPSRLSSWLYNIAWRAAVDWKRRHRQDVALHNLPSDDFPREKLSVGPVGAVDLVRLEEDVQLYQALLSLDPRCRRVLRALYLERERPTYAELADQEGLPVGSIGPIRARCLDRMKEAINRLSKCESPRLPPGSEEEQGSP